MKKGFTLIELLAAISIIILLNILIFASSNATKRRKECDINSNNMTEFCIEYRKEKNFQTASNVDNIYREKQYSESTKEFDPTEVEPTDEQMCGDITDPDVKEDCFTDRYNTRMIQNCIERYSSE